MDDNYYGKKLGKGENEELIFKLDINFNKKVIIEQKV